jgi:uncharacterized protein YecE (DUF72 family)
MGWGYADWAGVFYPETAAPREYITFYAEVFNTVEIDSTFYAIPRENQVKHWGRVTPDHFVFCPKVPRIVTHELRLVDATPELTTFARVMGLLGPRRGPMLLQMPPDFTRHELPALQAFLPTLKELNDPAARFAIEFRHRSMAGEDIRALLAEHNVALVAADYPPMPKRLEPTADFAYVRLIGRHGAFKEHRKLQADRMEDLQRWAEALRPQQDRFTVAYVFCNNDFEGYGPATANRFKQLLGLPTKSASLAAQPTLF